MSSKRADILAGLKTAFEAMENDPNTYNTDIAQVTEFAKPISQLMNESQPVLMILDTGEELPRVYDGTNYQIVLSVNLRAYFRGGSEETLQEDASKLISDIQTFIDSEPTIHAQVLKYRLVGIIGIDYRAADKHGPASCLIDIETQLRYYVAGGDF